MDVTKTQRMGVRLAIVCAMAFAVAACNTAGDRQIDYSRVGFESDDGSR
ncbi:MAG: hypothetical protein AAGF45_05170 [Pseudomonadota bacterium]